MDHSSTSLSPQPIEHNDSTLLPRKKPRKYPWLVLLLGSTGLLLSLAGVSLTLYNQALQPVDDSDLTVRSIEIVTGSTPQDIGKTLKESGVIRSELAFAIYTRIERVQNQLQAGTYQLRPSDSTRSIVAALTNGAKEEEIEVTFLPGGTVADAKKTLIKSGFSQKETDEAFAASYDHPLFEGKPSSADLEGYLYGETHRFRKNVSVKDILKRFFDDFYEVVGRENLREAYKKQNLTLYEGITLASIIQRETDGKDEAQVAQVFFLRMRKGMQLGSDVTYQYIADKLGLDRDVNLDNKYNTRRYVGLPPGPISAPGKRALTAVANPAAGDYLYFLSGDDGVTYFARTNEGHEQNIKLHCRKKCEII